MLHIRLLGGFEVRLDGQTVQSFESDKSRALLVYLAVEHVRPQPRERLAGLFWPDYSDHRARRNLSQALYALRKTLFPDDRPAATAAELPLAITNHTIQFKVVDHVALDVDAFRKGLAGCRRHAPSPTTACDACMAGLEGAVALYRGNFLDSSLSLPGCPAFQEWCLLEREALLRATISALEDLAAWRRLRGDLAAAREYARRAVALDPLWEPARRQLIHALWRDGRRAEALAQYQACRELLAAELGVAPDQETERLVRRIRADQPSRSADQIGGALIPHPLTPFIGRRDELAQIREQLNSVSCRLLTLVGPGGSGKTRLAIELAHQVAKAFPDGTVLVNLSPVASPEAFLPAIARGLGLPLQEKRDAESQLQDYLREKRLLLVLDSFEGIVACAPVAVQILQAAPRVKVLATSRQRLQVKGEHLYQVGGLHLPDEPAGRAAGDAVQLFLSAARRVVPDYQPDEGDLAAIGIICHRVMGMPLGIILASAWLEMLTPAEIAAQIRNSLDFLAVDWPDLPERQRSLRATLDYTWQLLEPQHQRVFQALSVFRGGFIAAAAERVAGASMADLLAFTHRFLIQREADGRYAIHDFLRQFAAEKLARALPAHDQAQERHGRYYLERLARWAPDLKNQAQIQTLARLDAENGNLAAAWEWGVTRSAVEDLVQAAECLGLYYALRGRIPEGVRAFARAAAAAKRTRPNQQQLLASVTLQTWQARFLRLSGEREKADQLRESCRLALAELPAAGIAAQPAQAFLYRETGDALLPSDREAAQERYGASLALYQSAGDDWGTGHALIGLGAIAHHKGQYNEALAYYQDSLTHFQNRGDARGIARVTAELGHNSLRLGLFDDGERYMRASMAMFEAIGDRTGKASSLFNLARTNFWRGNWPKCLEFFQQSLPLFQELGFLEEVAFNTSGLAGVCCGLGEYDEAISWAETCLNLPRQLPRWWAYAYTWLGVAALAQERYPEARRHLQKSVDGYADLGQADELATAMGFLGGTLLRSGPPAEAPDEAPGEARRLLQSALAIAVEARGLYSAVFVMPQVALYLAFQGQVEKAVEIYALIHRYPMVANGQLWADVAGRDIERLAADLPPETVAAAQARGREADLWATATALLEDLFAPALA
jgi:predicted ATPase/DNA-binding SARP family transcriptional activator